MRKILLAALLLGAGGGAHAGVLGDLKTIAGADRAEKSGLAVPAPCADSARPFIEAPDVTTDPGASRLVNAGGPLKSVAFPDKSRDQGREAEVLAARDLAVSILGKAERMATVDKDKFRDSADKLRSLPAWPEPGQDFQLCASEAGPVAFVLRVPFLISKMYLCDAAFTGSYPLAQIIVHEAQHRRGVSGECAATRWEVAAMVLAGYEPYFNGYWDECSLDPETIYRDFTRTSSKE